MKFMLQDILKPWKYLEVQCIYHRNPLIVSKSDYLWIL